MCIRGSKRNEKPNKTRGCRMLKRVKVQIEWSSEGERRKQYVDAGKWRE